MDRLWEPPDGPVLALFEVHGPGARTERHLSSDERYHGIVDGAAGPVIVRMPPLIDRQFDHWMTAIAGGMSLVFERVRDRPDEHGSLIPRGLYRFDLATATWSRLPVDPGPRPRRWFTTTANADGSRVIVVTHRVDDPPADVERPWDSTTTTVWEIADGQSRQVATLRGMWREGTEPAAHLSPDGTLLALAIQEQGTWSCQCVVLDMATGDRVVQHARATPWGSAAWSPDGRHLLVTTSGGPGILDLDTLEISPLPVAPGQLGEPGGGRAFPAGFLDDDHLLIYSERHNHTRETTRLTIASVPVLGTERTPLCVWTAPRFNQYIRPHFAFPIQERLRALAAPSADSPQV